MTCHDCQKNLLQLLDPAAPPADVAEHLAQCAGCQQYQRRLVRIESNVPRLPVPASQGLAAFKQVLLDMKAAAPEPHADTTPMEVAPSPATIPMVVPGGDLSTQRKQVSGCEADLSTQRKQVSRSRWLFAGVLAASVMFLAVGVYQILHWFGPHPHNVVKNDDEQRKVPEPKQEVPLLAELIDCNVRLASADTPRRQTETMAQVAGYLEDGIESKPDAATMKQLADLYCVALIGDEPDMPGLGSLVSSAGRLPKEDLEPALTPVLGDLARFQEQLATLAPALAMKKIAGAVQEARQRLGHLLPAGVEKAIAKTPARNRVLAVNWKRDLPLVQAMVVTAGKLVLEDNSLKRARFAQELAVRLGKEIKQAARDRNGPRGAEMSKFLGRLLTEAIADNISRTRRLEPDNKDLNRFAQEVSKTSQAVEADLRDLPGMKDTLQLLAAARSDVERSTTGEYRRQNQ